MIRTKQCKYSCIKILRILPLFVIIKRCTSVKNLYQLKKERIKTKCDGVLIPITNTTIMYQKNKNFRRQMHDKILTCKGIAYISEKRKTILFLKQKQDK